MQQYMMNPNNYPIDLSAYQQQLMMQMMQQQQRQNQNNMMNQGNWQNQQGQNNQNTSYNNRQFIGVFVDSFEQAKDYPVPIGQPVVFMNSNNNMIYTKRMLDNGDIVYNKYRFEVLDGQLENNMNQSQNTQNTQSENINQQPQNNKNKGEQMVAELLETIKQLKENHDNLTERIDKAFGIVDNRLRQLEKVDDTL